MKSLLQRKNGELQLRSVASEELSAASGGLLPAYRPTPGDYTPLPYREDHTVVSAAGTVWYDE